MRVQVTRKRIDENFKCISVGYCELQNLLKYEPVKYYTTGIYGWNFDVYTFEYKGANVAITTGYRGMVDNCKNNYTYDLGKDFDSRAAGASREECDLLIKEFLDIVFKEFF